MSQCDTCLYHSYDDVSAEYFCDYDIDEDEMARLAMEPTHKREKSCPYYRDGDEYKTVRHQM